MTEVVKLGEGRCSREKKKGWCAALVERVGGKMLIL